MNKTQSFLKIVSFQDFREFCNNRTGEICSQSDNKTFTCLKPDKKTMNLCPIWKCFENFNQRGAYGRDGGEKKFKEWQEGEEN